MTRRWRALAVLTAVLALTACGQPPATPTPAPSPATATRPACPVTVTVVSPANGEVVHGRTVHVVLQVEGGTVVQQTSPETDPTKGHVHLYLQGQLIYMSYTLAQDVPVSPGANVLYAEWVGTDHVPCSPRDVTPHVFFTVQ